jgi:toxin ParE1/3/4
VARVRLSRPAERDLLDIGRYIARDNPDAADRFLELITEKLEMLARSPEIGRHREEVAPRLRSFPVGRYVIFYRIAEQGIEVARVVSAYRDLGTLFS